MASVNVKNMTSGSPGKLILFFAIPLMLGNVFQQFYTMVDAMVVGQVVGVEALAAVGAADWLIWLVQGVEREVPRILYPGCPELWRPGWESPEKDGGCQLSAHGSHCCGGAGGQPDGAASGAAVSEHSGGRH